MSVMLMQISNGRNILGDAQKWPKYLKVRYLNGDTIRMVVSSEQVVIRET